METRKIGLACFIGGALFMIAALAVNPSFWWLGILAGMAGGYISYEFREVLRAAPRAFRIAREDAGLFFGLAKIGFSSIKKGVVGYFSEQHPVAYPVTMAIVLGFSLLAYELLIVESGDLFTGRLILAFFILELMAGMFGFLLSYFPLLFFAYIGARFGEKCFWYPFLDDDGKNPLIRRQLLGKGYREAPLTYRNFYRWFFKGIGISLLFLAWTMWKYAVIYSGIGAKFAARFGYHLFVLVHSQKRVLCALDGTLGGIVTYFWFTPASASFPEAILLAASGGILGAAFGILNWEIISKRVLRLPASTA